MQNKILMIAIIAVILAAFYGIFLFDKKSAAILEARPLPAEVSPQAPSVEVSPQNSAEVALQVAAPIVDALARVTKKPFGIYVRPGHSPITPEHFTGYHTGTDFETLPSEQNIAVPIFAICAGKILVKKNASGYGGVLVEACALAGEPVTIIYGHLSLASIVKKIGENFSPGEKIGVLGKGFSAETAGERKHLHLGIHKGGGVDILGYVQKQSDLSQWINVVDYLK
jgi:murein DD-endopeptidase MepM/ murein hydrolase activator NlpD